MKIMRKSCTSYAQVIFSHMKVIRESFASHFQIICKLFASPLQDILKLFGSRLKVIELQDNV